MDQLKPALNKKSSFQRAGIIDFEFAIFFLNNKPQIAAFVGLSVAHIGGIVGLCLDVAKTLAYGL